MMRGLRDIMSMINKKELINNRYVKLLYKSDIWFALVINIFFLGLVLICCDLKYEVSDDFVMASILSGAYGDSQNPQMIFVNVIIGYLLLPFYRIFPRVSWYFIAQLLLVFISSTSITWLLLKKVERIKAVMLSVLLILFFTNDAYILMQFTKTAMYAIMAGSMIFIWGIFREKKRIPVIYGGCLCLLGTMVRFSTIYIVGPYLIFMIGYEVFLMMKKQGLQKNELKALFRWFVIIAISGGGLIGIAFGLNKLDSYTYHNDEEYGFFSEYNGARAGIVDIADYGYQVYADELQKIGISENDYAMLKKWGFADNEYFSLDKLQEISKIIKKYYKGREVTFENLLDSIQSREVQKYPIYLVCILILFIGAFFDYKKWWMSLTSIVAGMGLLMYFAYRERSIYRIEYCVFLGMFLSMIYFWEKKDSFVKEECGLQNQLIVNRMCVITITLCVLGNILVYIPDTSYQSITSDTRKEYIDNKFYHSWNYNAGKYRRVVNKYKPENELLKEFEQNPDNYYFMDFTTTIQTLYFEYSPWKALPVGYYSNFSYLSGVTSNFPDVVKHLEEKEITNPLKSLVEENVYLVDNQNLGLKLDYLKEHYYPNVRAELYKTLSGYHIWKLYKE